MMYASMYLQHKEEVKAVVKGKGAKGKAKGKEKGKGRGVRAHGDGSDAEWSEATESEEEKPKGPVESQVTDSVDVAPESEEMLLLVRNLVEDVRFWVRATDFQLETAIFRARRLDFILRRGWFCEEESQPVPKGKGKGKAKGKEKGKAKKGEANAAFRCLFERKKGVSELFPSAFN